MTAAAGERAAAWGVVVPVKRLDVAKSRLQAYGDDARVRLALAFAADVVLAAVTCPAVRKVLVVTDDDRAAQAVLALGAVVVADLPAAGLNPALEHGAELLRAGTSDLGVATVSADLPSLRPGDLAGVLAQTTARAFVADAAGTGTTVLAAAAGHRLGPRYGPGSRDGHVASGALELGGDLRLRRDVDTPGDLLEALALGVGPCTAQAARDLGVRA
jgi:2-phospho-L-lactate guanylyltransferase